MLQLREDRVNDRGAVVFRRGDRVEAKPTHAGDTYAVRHPKGSWHRVDARALEPVDDVDLPEPEAVPALVSESLLNEDVYALPFSVAAVVTLVVALVMMGG